jgi:predicted nucleic acid-binding protein
MSIADIREMLSTIHTVCKVVPAGEETHDLGLQIAERHGLSVYDAMIVAALAPDFLMICLSKLGW